jgi:(1->4)-alpha-D-glucan 1-alpha-D-glucosylmutase
LPLVTEGTAREHVVAFARVASADTGAAKAAAIVVAPRLTTTLVSNTADAPVGDAVWAGTLIRLPEQLRDRSWTCLLTGQHLPASTDVAVAQTLRSFPVALLVSTT